MTPSDDVTEQIQARLDLLIAERRTARERLVLKRVSLWNRTRARVVRPDKPPWREKPN